MTAPANEKVVSSAAVLRVTIDIRKLVTLAKQECGFEEEEINQLEDFLAEKKFRVSAGELARKLAELGASREQVLAFLRKFKVEDSYIAQAMKHVPPAKFVTLTRVPDNSTKNQQPAPLAEIAEKFDFSKYKKVRKPLRGVKG